MVDGERLTLAVGQAYELDNMRIHAVENRSPIDRIHLIVDYFEAPVTVSPVASPVAQTPDAP